MSNIIILSENDEHQAALHLQEMKKKIGMIPNIFGAMANSLEVLEGFQSMKEKTQSFSLSAALQEKMALFVAELNHCDYCIAAHTAMAKGEGLSEEQILQARKGNDTDAKYQAILSFTKEVVEKKGHVSSEQVELLKSAGVSDQEIVEITMIISLNIFTNYFNHIVDTEVDF